MSCALRRAVLVDTGWQTTFSALLNHFLETCYMPLKHHEELQKKTESEAEVLSNNLFSITNLIIQGFTEEMIYYS